MNEPTAVVREKRGTGSLERMVRCASCKYWGTKPGERGNPRLRSCNHPKHVMGYQSAAAVPDDGMIIESDEGWGIEVGPLFGCVNGEASTPNGALCDGDEPPQTLKSKQS
jgi:hypothetical protein